MADTDSFGFRRSMGSGQVLERGSALARPAHVDSKRATYPTVGSRRLIFEYDLGIGTPRDFDRAIALVRHLDLKSKFTFLNGFIVTKVCDFKSDIDWFAV